MKFLELLLLVISHVLIKTKWSTLYVLSNTEYKASGCKEQIFYQIIIFIRADMSPNNFLFYNFLGMYTNWKLKSRIDPNSSPTSMGRNMNSRSSTLMLATCKIIIMLNGIFVKEN